MRNVTRGFLALSVLLWLMAAPSGTAAPQQGQLSPNDGTVDSGVPCGQEPDDADQVAAVRALADEQCDCDSATNHGKYVNCVAKVAEEAVAEGELREECQDTVVSCAAQSTCGFEGAVACCRTDATGNTTCSINHDHHDHARRDHHDRRGDHDHDRRGDHHNDDAGTDPVLRAIVGDGGLRHLYAPHPCGV